LNYFKTHDVKQNELAFLLIKMAILSRPLMMTIPRAAQTLGNGSMYEMRKVSYPNGEVKWKRRLDRGSAMAVPLEMCLDGEDRRWQHSSLG
jgi:hypothetical protein